MPPAGRFLRLRYPTRDWWHRRPSRLCADAQSAVRARVGGGSVLDYVALLVLQATRGARCLSRSRGSASSSSTLSYSPSQHQAIPRDAQLALKLGGDRARSDGAVRAAQREDRRACCARCSGRASRTQIQGSTFFEKALTLDLVHFETPEVYDKLQNARREASSRPLNLFVNSVEIASRSRDPGQLRGAVVRLQSPGPC